MDVFLRRALGLVAVASIGCSPGATVPSRPPEPVATSVPEPTAPIETLPIAPIRPASASVAFEDVHASLGVEFQYDTGANGRAFMVESTGGGGGWIDYDRDGWCDVYLVQGGNPTESPTHPAGDRIFRNLDGRFIDVTDATARVDREYGQGLAVGDFDDDGFDDVFVANVGPDVLLRNMGDGTFADVTDEAGMADPRWGSSAAWSDLDLDGDLDLFVCNYLKYDVFHPKECRTSDGRPAICHPEEIDPEDNACYENLGNGTFRRVEEAWNLLGPGSKSLGVAIADFNGDLLPDIYVANDTTANHLFVQEGPGRFVERGVAMGCAMNGLGQYQASMGVACGDYDGNGYLDLYVTHFTGDSNTLYANLGPTGFHDETRIEGLHKPTLPYLGFGTVMVDFNCDGFQELMIANGHIDDWRHKNEPYAMPPQLFSFNGERWDERTAEAGAYFRGNYLGRALSTADFDRDGDIDALVVHQNAPAALLRNDSPLGNWLLIELVGVRSNRRGVNAIVEVRQGDRRLVQHLVGGTSYCSAHEPALHFGLGTVDGECEVTVRWPRPGYPSQTVASGVNRRIVIREQTSD
jgi:hypothetical protein